MNSNNGKFSPYFKNDLEKPPSFHIRPTQLPYVGASSNFLNQKQMNNNSNFGGHNNHFNMANIYDNNSMKPSPVRVFNNKSNNFQYNLDKDDTNPFQMNTIYSQYQDDPNQERQQEDPSPVPTTKKTVQNSPVIQLRDSSANGSKSNIFKNQDIYSDPTHELSIKYNQVVKELKMEKLQNQALEDEIKALRQNNQQLLDELDEIKEQNQRLISQNEEMKNSFNNNHHHNHHQQYQDENGDQEEEENQNNEQQQDQNNEAEQHKESHPRHININELKQLLILLQQQNPGIFNGDEQGLQEDLPDYNIDPDQMTYEELLALQDKIGYVSKGLPKEEIKKIKKELYSDQHQEKGDLCSVCYSEFNKDEKIRILSCNHIYHSQCIQTWLGNEKKCPVCKQEIEIKNQ